MGNGDLNSPAQKLGMQFCNKKGLHADPELKLYNYPYKDRIRD